MHSPVSGTYHAPCVAHWMYAPSSLRNWFSTQSIVMGTWQQRFTVENFLTYVNDKHYDGTIFHRVIPDFMIQGGGMDKDMKQRQTRSPIKNEAANGLKNTAGTIVMARTSDPNSATAQFFINVKDNAFLDHRDDSAAGFGYAVFGRVIEGEAVMKKIEKVPTGARSSHRDVPVEPVVIESIRVVE